MGNAENKLMRDFDILGIRDEIELILIEKHSTPVPIEIFNNEYEACLKQNDIHVIKITKVLIHYYNYSPYSKECTRLYITFSNSCRLLLFSHSSSLNIFVYEEENSERILLNSQISLSAREIKAFMIFDEGNSIIDSVFKMLAGFFIEHKEISEILKPIIPS